MPGHPLTREVLAIDPDVQWHSSYSGRGQSGRKSPIAFISRARPGDHDGRRFIDLGFDYDSLGRDFVYYLTGTGKTARRFRPDGRGRLLWE